MVCRPATDYAGTNDHDIGKTLTDGWSTIRFGHVLDGCTKRLCAHGDQPGLCAGGLKKFSSIQSHQKAFIKAAWSESNGNTVDDNIAQGAFLNWKLLGAGNKTVQAQDVGNDIDVLRCLESSRIVIGHGHPQLIKNVEDGATLPQRREPFSDVGGGPVAPGAFFTMDRSSALRLLGGVDAKYGRPRAGRGRGVALAVGGPAADEHEAGKERQKWESYLHRQ
jgi:hypothetical protein